MNTITAPVTPRERAYSGLPNEDFFGYCRAIKVDDKRVIVSGCTALAGPEGVAPEHKGDMYAQCVEAFRRMKDVLSKFDLGFEHVVRTNCYLTDASQLGDVIKAHGEVFGQIKPSNNTMGVTFLFHPDCLIEIDAEAYI
jgi:enamine deaminase RidA (YjgF/YER057c/UK114 family)